MKKLIIFSAIVLALFAVAAIYFSINTGFKVVRPVADQINKNIARDLSKIVIIPQGIRPPSQDFESTAYEWEMETPAKEVTAVRFSYTPAFTKSSNKIVATLEMSENGDASIFDKVLPAIIIDRQSLAAARDPQKANLGASESAHYSSIKLTVSPKTGKTTKISWEFEKKNLSSDLQSSYKKINKYPDPILKFLYKIPGFVISLFRA